MRTDDGNTGAPIDDMTITPQDTSPHTHTHVVEHVAILHSPGEERGKAHMEIICVGTD